MADMAVCEVVVRRCGCERRGCERRGYESVAVDGRAKCKAKCIRFAAPRPEFKRRHPPPTEEGRQEAFEDHIFGFLKAASLAMKSLFTLAAIAGALLPAAQACIGSPGGKCPIWPKEFSSPVSQKTIDMCGLLPATLPLFTPPE